MYLSPLEKKIYTLALERAVLATASAEYQVSRWADIHRYCYRDPNDPKNRYASDSKNLSILENMTKAKGVLAEAEAMEKHLKSALGIDIS